MVTRLHDKEMTTFTINFGENCIFTCKRMKVDPFITPYISINSNGLRAKLNVTRTTNIRKGKSISDIEMVKYCLHMTSKHKFKKN